MAGKKTREEAHDEFIQALDPDGNKDISKIEFLSFFKDISLAFEVDDDFIKFARSMWRRRR